MRTGMFQELSDEELALLDRVMEAALAHAMPPSLPRQEEIRLNAMWLEAYEERARRKEQPKGVLWKSGLEKKKK